MEKIIQEQIYFMMNIATSYEKQDKFDEAEVMNKKCLAKNILINSKDHPPYFRAMSWLFSRSWLIDTSS